MKEQATCPKFSRRTRWAAVMSLILGLLSIALNLWPAGLVLPLQSWLGEFLPLFLPLAIGALASGLAVLGLVWAPRLSWLAIAGLVFGAIGMVLGSLLAVVTVTMLLQYNAQVFLRFTRWRLPCCVCGFLVSVPLRCWVLASPQRLAGGSRTGRRSAFSRRQTSSSLHGRADTLNSDPVYVEGLTWTSVQTVPFLRKTDP
jgi:hypothetical protein